MIQLTCQKSGTYNYEVSYSVNDAGWTPYYDIRSNKIDSPINLTYKAKVYQNSNEYWENVNLSLSTGNLNQSNKAPSFHANFFNSMKSLSLQFVTMRGCTN